MDAFGGLPLICDPKSAGFSAKNCTGLNKINVFFIHSPYIIIIIIIG